MVQKSLSLNKQKQQKGGRKHLKPVLSKVDVIKKKKKEQRSCEIAGVLARTRKIENKVEAKIAAKTALESNIDFKIVKITPQQMAAAKDKIGHKV
mmetsp:Transcript_51976/g.117409  ORF Transcript_51976/g.117409 Transcript_51976/m.117409 type:complete len:95 (+) Transcript_51976:96-380(+)